MPSIRFFLLAMLLFLPSLAVAKDVEERKMFGGLAFIDDGKGQLPSFCPTAGAAVLVAVDEQSFLCGLLGEVGGEVDGGGGFAHSPFKGGDGDDHIFAFLKFCVRKSPKF